LKTLISTSIYFLGTILEKGLAFLLIPLYTHYLSTKDYGILTIIQSLIAINTIIFSLSLNGAASRFHFDGNKLYRQFHYGNIFLSVTIFSVIGSLLLFLVKDKLFLLIGNVPIYPYIYFVIVISYTTVIFSLYQLMLQMEHKAIRFVTNNIIKFLLTTLLTVYFILILNKKADGVLLASAIVYIFFTIYIFIQIRKQRIKLNLNKKLLKKNLSYSIYLVPHNLASILNTFLDRFFITNMINISNAGVYALAGQISGVLGIFSIAINRAATPSILKAYKDRNYQYLINLANISIIFIALMTLFVSLFSYEIINLISPQSYHKASNIIPILGFYYVVQMYYFMTVGVLFYKKEATKYVAVATLLSLSLNFIFNYFFIKWWGIQGAAVATLLSIVIVNYIVIFIANRYIVVGFEHKKIHFIIISGFLIANINSLFLLGILLKLVIFFGYMFAILFLERNNPLLDKIKRKISEYI